MRTDKEILMMQQWDEQFPQYAPDHLGKRVAVRRCPVCLKPTPNKEKCCEEKCVCGHNDAETMDGCCAQCDCTQHNTQRDENAV
jgi:hypothetical protein